MTTDIEFVGFFEPTENYFRLPNNWFDIATLIRAEFGERFGSPLKMMEYILRHTWGYRRFNGHVKLSAKDIYSGRNINGRQIDQGTGLSENSVTKAGKVLEKLGLIEMEYDETDKARRIRTFRPRIQEENVEESTESDAFVGFDLPTENYFKVPASWTNLTRETGSAACILTTEYLFRHGWGYNNPNGVWMDTDDIANGRKYVNTKRRYDKGIGFEISTINRAISEAVERGFLVWAERWDDHNYTMRRVYNLRLRGMPVAADGRYMGRLPWDDDIPSEAQSAPVSIVEVGMCIVEAKPTSIVEEVSRTDEDFGSVVEVVESAYEAVISTNEARTETPHTFKDTSNQHLNQTLSTTPSRAGEEKTTPQTICADDVDAVESGEVVGLTELPVEIREGLARLQWTDTGDEIDKIYRKSPTLVGNWLNFALAAPNIHNRAGLFRKGVRSGKQPPYQVERLPQQEPEYQETVEDDEITDSEPTEAAPWPELGSNAIRAWNMLITQLQMEMSKSTYETYLQETGPVDYRPDDGIFVIGARSEYNRMWLEGRITSTCKRVLTGVLNRSVDVSFVIW
jgi:hypothetical protein